MDTHVGTGNGEFEDRRQHGRRAGDTTALTARQLNKLLVVSVLILVMMTGTLAVMSYTAVTNATVAAYNQGVNLYLNCKTMYLIRPEFIENEPYCDIHKFGPAKTEDLMKKKP